MSYDEKVVEITLPAAADLTGHNNKFCTFSASGVALNTSAGGACAGVISPNDADAAGKPTGVMVGGVAKVAAGAAVAAGASVQSDATGRAITAAAADYVQGIALEAATAAGDLIAVLLQGPAQNNA